jgi:rhomboid protease GluP
MERKGGQQPATGPWEAFALAAIAPLGPFSQVHLAPKIPPGLLNNALLTYLLLERDELLLAIIEGGGKPEGCCALTSRRVYWDELADAATDESNSNANQVQTSRGGRPVLVCQAVQYLGLPETILQEEAGTGSFRFDLGVERSLVLSGVDASLARAVGRYLETMGRTARAGTVPAPSEVDRVLAARIPGVLRAVAGVTAHARNFSRELIQFRRAVFASTPRVVLTPLYVVVCVAAFLLMVAFGVPVLWPSGNELVAWGANHGPRVVLRHEYWRLLTGVFVHGGLIHLAMNMWSLLVIGPLVERLYGNLAFAVLYLAAGVGGSVASIAAYPERIGVGASGAICGVLGALVAFLVTHRRSIPSALLKSLRGNVLGIIVFMAILGFIFPNIDQEAHLGGLATGFVGGLLLYRPLPAARSKWAALRRALATILFAGATAGAAWAMTQRAGPNLPPLVRIGDVMEQTSPAARELDAIYAAIPSTLALNRDRADPFPRQAHLQRIDELTRRAAANLARLRRVTTTDHELRIMVDSLKRAQSNQLECLKAARRYLETGDLGALTGPSGFRDKLADARRERTRFNQQQTTYIIDHNISQYQVVPEP